MELFLIKPFLFCGLTALFGAAVAQTAPVISYNGGANAVSFIQGSPGSNSPAIGCDAVPAIAYGVVSTPETGKRWSMNIPVF